MRVDVKMYGGLKFCGCCCLRNYESTRLGFAAASDFALALRLDSRSVLKARIDLAFGNAGVQRFDERLYLFERADVADGGENFEKSNLSVAVYVLEKDVEGFWRFELLEVSDRLLALLLRIERAYKPEQALILPHTVERPIEREPDARVFFLNAIAFDQPSMLDSGHARKLFGCLAPLVRIPA